MLFSAIRGTIQVFCLSASGQTGLSAFHNALCAADLDGYNLVHLSSVIPPRTAVSHSMTKGLPTGERGDRLYCVYAEQRSDVPGQEVWAGLGWIQLRDGTGGLFVEHTGSAKDLVEEAIQASLSDLAGDSPDRYGRPEWALQGAVCTGQPVCALVIAPYESVHWRGTA
jgi:arginine decarboxylase